MLTKWSLGGFKSFKDKYAFDISPITILAGANSSGKSTILQSILLLKQTVQYGSANRPLALNGPLIRLGTFDDILHYGSEVRSIMIDFTFDFSQITTLSNELTPWLRRFNRPSAYNEPRIKRIEGSFVWIPRPPGNNTNSNTTHDKLRFDISSGRINVVRESKKSDVNFISYRTGNIPGDLFDDFPFAGSAPDVDLLSYEEITKDKPDPKIEDIAIYYFLPSWIRISFNAAKKRAQNIADAICSIDDNFLTRSQVEQTVLSRTLAETVNDWLSVHHIYPIPIEADGIQASELWKKLERFRNTHPLAADSSPELTQLREVIQSALMHEMPSSRESEFEQPRAIDMANDFIRSYLSTGIRYLGPLRDEPKPVYPLEALENTTDVGYRGEHTAAVLYLHGNRTIEFIDPSAIDATHDFKPRAVRLRSAVAAWMNYMGVAVDVFASDAGVFGNQLQVQTEGSSNRNDLTNVGVGVSQVLPIVLSALIAPKTSLLIFEQPELHLHPRVQARLADFFFAIALLGKRCILETHSEYLIDRFRRRIAEEDNGLLHSMLGIYFTERKDGITNCRRINVSGYGAITEWPKDFFDQSQIEARTILRASSAKRIKNK
jgi:predicted ATPase